MLSYCVWKAILRAIKGAWVSWGKLERTASVPAPSVITNLPGLLSANAKMFAPNHVKHLIKQFRFVCSFATSMLKAGASHLCRVAKKIPGFATY